MRWRRGFFRIGIAAFINFAGHPFFPELYVGVIEHGERVNAVTPESKDAKGLESLEQAGITHGKGVAIIKGSLDEKLGGVVDGNYMSQRQRRDLP